MRLWLAIATAASLACYQHPEARQDTMEVHGLDETADASVGQLLEVRPFHGYGWGESHLIGQTYSHKDIPAPPPFKVRVKRLWSYGDVKRRGGVGQVESPGHPLDGLWLIFSTRHAAHYNFTDKIGAYNTDLSSLEPSASNAEGWPIIPNGTLAKTGYSGWAEIAVRFPKEPDR
jgi:hypothetical protein